MPTLDDLRNLTPRSPTKLATQKRDVLVSDRRSQRRPTDFVEQKLLAALQRPSATGEVRTNS